MDAAEIRRLFLQVLEIEPAKRSEYLENSCESAELRVAVLTLLRHDSGGGPSSFLRGIAGFLQLGARVPDVQRTEGPRPLCAYKRARQVLESMEGQRCTAVGKDHERRGF